MLAPFGKSSAMAEAAPPPPVAPTPPPVGPPPPPPVGAMAEATPSSAVAPPPPVAPPPVAPQPLVGLSPPVGAMPEATPSSAGGAIADATSQSAASSSTAPPTDSPQTLTKPKQPQNPFIMFLNERRAGLVATGLSCLEAQRKASTMWLELPEEQKRPYLDSATKSKEVFRKEMDTFLAAGGKIMSKQKARALERLEKGQKLTSKQERIVQKGKAGMKIKREFLQESLNGIKRPATPSPASKFLRAEMERRQRDMEKRRRKDPPPGRPALPHSTWTMSNRAALEAEVKSRGEMSRWEVVVAVNKLGAERFKNLPADEQEAVRAEYKKKLEEWQVKKNEYEARWAEEEEELQRLRRDDMKAEESEEEEEEEEEEEPLDFDQDFSDAEDF